MYKVIIRPFVTYVSECWVKKTNTKCKIASRDENTTGCAFLEYQSWNKLEYMWIEQIKGMPMHGSVRACQ